MNKITLLMLALLLAGCASVPQTEPPNASREGVAAKSSAQTAKPAPPTPSQKPVDKAAQQCLAQVLYWEARGEGRQGMVAVASVVFNRVDDARFPDSVCGVVHEGGETPPCQFSWWCDGKSDHPANESAWLATNRRAAAMLQQRPDDPTDGALFFHNTSIKTPWRRTLTAKIGNHIFYR